MCVTAQARNIAEGFPLCCHGCKAYYYASMHAPVAPVPVGIIKQKMLGVCVCARKTFFLALGILLASNLMLLRRTRCLGQPGKQRVRRNMLAC